MHDYDPSWDYPVRDPGPEDEKIISTATAEIRSRVMHALGFTGFKVFCVEPGGLGEDRVAVYVDGTSSHPVIGLDVDAIRAGCEEYGLDLPDQIRVSIVHELAHAYEEASGLDDHDESAAERFAEAFVERSVVDISILHRPPARAAMMRR